jgi:acetyl-CoA carboxylase/biotin carboxylase 1
LRSDVTGKVVRFLQPDGAIVEKDKPFVEVEAMKMIMALKASESGVITHNLSPGSILAAGDLIATLQLKDPSRVKQIKAFRDTLPLAPRQPPAPSVEEAIERLTLAMEGYDHDLSTLLSVLTAETDVNTRVNLFTTQLRKFLDVEKPFIGQEESTVLSTLSKSSKENPGSLVPVLIARKQLRQRVGAVLTILRELEAVSELFGVNHNTARVPMPAPLGDALDILSHLEGPLYGEMALKARQLLEEAQTPPFQTRLDALKTAVLAAGADLNQLAVQPNMAVSVDLLTVLMTDSDAEVRRAAMEVYLRRVYRAHVIKVHILYLQSSICHRSSFMCYP